MNIDIYSTRELNRFLEERLTPKRFFRNRLFRQELTHDAEHIDVDLRRGTRAVARFINPANAAGTVNRTGFTTISLSPPHIKEQMVLTAQQLKTRIPGEHSYSGMSPDERAAFWLGKDTEQLDDLIGRREELMCRDVLFDGKITISGTGIQSYDIDYGFTNDIDLNDQGYVPWDGTGADIRKDFRTFRQLVNGKCGRTLDMAVLGADVADVLFSDETVAKFLDNRRTEIGMLKFEQNPVEGSIYHGNLWGIDLWTYDELYIDPADGTTTREMVPANKVLFADSRVPMTMHYGCVTFFDKDGNNQAESYAQARVGRSWDIKDPSARIYLMESRPLPDPVAIDSFVVVTALEDDET